MLVEILDLIDTIIYGHGYSIKKRMIELKLEFLSLEEKH